jgi:hypothetical protein
MKSPLPPGDGARSLCAGGHRSAFVIGQTHPAGRPDSQRQYKPILCGGKEGACREPTADGAVSERKTAHVVTDKSMTVESKSLRLPVPPGARSDGWHVCRLGGWKPHRFFFIPVVGTVKHGGRHAHQS